jgi:sigma54-dependent transcription regulator
VRLVCFSLVDRSDEIHNGSTSPVDMNPRSATDAILVARHVDHIAAANRRRHAVTRLLVADHDEPVVGLARGGRIALENVQEEIARLRNAWDEPKRAGATDEGLLAVLNPAALDQIDLFDRVQLGHVVKICRHSRTLSEAGRKLYGASRARKTSANDADRLRKYLGRFSLDWESVTAS